MSELPKIVGYITSDGVLYLFTTADKLRAFMDSRGNHWSQCGWICHVVIDAQPVPLTGEDLE